MSQYRALDTVLQQLQDFKRKIYLNLLIRGLLFSVGLLLSAFLIYNLLEYFFYFPYYIRAFLFFSFLGLALYVFVRWILAPLSALAHLRRLLSDEQAATQVGQYFPEISDKLLNTIQLKDLNKDNELILASIEQKSSQLSLFRFTDSVKLEENKPFLKYALVPLLLVLGITLLYPSIFVQGTERIVNYQKFYAPAAPFQFIIRNEALSAFRNEDFQLQVEVEGEVIPNEVSILYNGREQKLTRSKGNVFSFEFKKLQRPVDFQLEGSGFRSDQYTLELLARPNLKDFYVQVNYPDYLNKKSETIRNTGNLSVPAGSVVDWNFVAGDTEKLQLLFQSPEEVLDATGSRDSFKASKKILQTQPYAIKLRNQHSLNKEEITYLINAIPDRHPEITLESFSDTLSFSYMVLGGNIGDDYGLTRLNLHYRVIPASGEQNTAFKALPVGFDRRQLSQTYYHQWNLDPLRLHPGDRLEYFVQVWDNDGVNGSKSSRTRTMGFKVPSRQDIRSELASNASDVQNQLSKSLEKAQKLKNEIAKSEDKLKTKKELNWQDRKSLEELVEKKKQLEQDLESLKKLNEQLNQKQDRFDQKSQQMAEKAQQLQKMMDELLDEETKKLYQELEKLLQQKNNELDLQQLLSKMDNKESTLEKQLERLLEMFKQLQFDQKMEQTTEKLAELAKEQEELAQKTEEKKADTQQLQQEQADLQKEFEEIKNDLKELEDRNQKMENPSEMGDMSGDEKQVEQEIQNSQEQLAKQQEKKASQSQKNAADKMKEMAQKMEQMQASMEMESQEENIGDLRAIMENLIKLSFDQEELMKSFRNVNQSDPRFVGLSQQQLKLRDDARMVEDSLHSLAKRVFQIESFVTRELGEMNQNMDQASQRIKDRNVGRATGHQQMAMTSMNNLALMLNDALKQMQEAQMQMMQMQAKGQGKPQKKGQGKPQPGDLGKMQEQLNQKIQDLQKSGKSGQGLSEELAKLAAEQEMLRQAMKELEKMGQQQGQKPGEGKLGDISKMMEQTETDLVNKRLTEQTVLRQREILTRLLEAEKAVKERELDEKREAEAATAKNRTMPPSFEKYLKTKEKQTELLKTISPSLSPYYKQEVSKYFQKIGN
ncbi:ATPase [soil metagenome]